MSMILFTWCNCDNCRCICVCSFTHEWVHTRSMRLWCAIHTKDMNCSRITWTVSQNCIKNRSRIHIRSHRVNEPLELTARSIYNPVVRALTSDSSVNSFIMEFSYNTQSWQCCYLCFWKYLSFRWVWTAEWQFRGKQSPNYHLVAGPTFPNLIQQMLCR